MSRCFPFPPPGYERKHKSEDLLELKEAKRKEKKERRDKKRSHREKNKKDGGDKKGRKDERKEKKERHCDKKKDENREKEKEKSSISQELTVARNLEQQSDTEFNLESRDYDGSSYVRLKKCSSLSHGHNGAKPFDYVQASQATTEAKFVEELNKRIEEDANILQDVLDAASESVFSRNHSVEFVGEKGGSRHKGVEIRNMDPLSLRDELTSKPIAQNYVRVSGIKVEGTPSIVEGNRRRDMKIDGEDKNNRNENPKIKTSENFEKSKNVGSSRSNGDFSLGAHDDILDERNLRKRKDVHANGFLHESSEVRPYKIQLQTIRHPTENGRKFVASRVFDKSRDNVASSDTHNAPVVGVMSSRNKGPDVPTVEALLTEASTRPLHPDAKYLSQVLTVPHMGEWSEYDDQDWLFSKTAPPPPPTEKATGETGATQVWSTAVRIGSPDVYALPYVVPY